MVLFIGLCFQLFTVIFFNVISYDFYLWTVQGTEVVPPNSRSHTCLLSGVFIGNIKVLVRLSFGLDGPKDVAMKLTVRSDNETVSDAIHEIVASG
jgi:hypothetical protein